MIGTILFPVLAFAFARAPMAECTSSPECVLVKSTYCGDLQSITIGQDEKWAKWEQKLAAASQKAKEVCRPRARMDPRMFEPLCEQGRCVVRAKGKNAP